MSPMRVMAEPVASVRKSSHVPELDAVRGIAILAVVIMHFHNSRAIPGWLTVMFLQGGSGVTLFFALSGALITGILLDTRGGAGYFRNFYMRRALRILPLYFAVVLAYFFVILPLGHGVAEVNPGWYLFHLSNWITAFGPDVLPLEHFWSLSIEEQFYLAWPAVVWWLPGRKLGWVCLSLIAISFAIRSVLIYHGATERMLYRLTPCQMDALAAGGLIAVALREKRWERLAQRLPFAGLIGLALWVCSLAAQNLTHMPLRRSVGQTALVLACAGLVAAAYRQSSPLLRSPILRSFGKYSYAIYVFHAPLAVY